MDVRCCEVFDSLEVVADAVLVLVVRGVCEELSVCPTDSEEVPNVGFPVVEDIDPLETEPDDSRGKILPRRAFVPRVALSI